MNKNIAGIHNKLLTIGLLMAVSQAGAQQTEYTLNTALGELTQWGQQAVEFSEYRWQKSRDELKDALVGSSILIAPAPIRAANIGVSGGIAHYQASLGSGELARWGAKAVRFGQSRPTDSYKTCVTSKVNLSLNDSSDRMAMELSGQTDLKIVGRIKAAGIDNNCLLNLVVQVTTWSPMTKADRAAARRVERAERRAANELARQSGAVKIRQMGMEFKSIPGGEFSMGSNSGDSDERPVHRVAIESFKLMKTEVTFAQWEACTAAGGCSYSPSDRGWGRGNRPVINVSFDDIQQFLDWLNGGKARLYRLPTEAEWEYAARAGTTTKYSWGNNVGSNNANCDGCGSQWDDSKTAPVGSFGANRLGLHDMHGNVWEWTQDCWNPSYNGAPSDGSAWTSGDCSRRVIRGGSWSNDPNYLRSANRHRTYTSNRTHFHGGFRLAQDQN